MINMKIAGKKLLNLLYEDSMLSLTQVGELIGYSRQSTAKLLNNAKENGADCIITPCPLCQLNLDAYQSKINKKFKTHFDLPILYFTQLIGVALGLESKSLALEKNIVSPMKVLSPYFNTTSKRQSHG